MAATIRSTAGGNSGAATASSFTVTPSTDLTGSTTGDVVVVACHIGGTSLTASASAGWTAVPGPTFPVDQSTNSRLAGAWYRRLDGTASDTLTITLSGSATGGWSAACVQGALASGTPVGTAPTPSTANTTSIGLPSITVSGGSCVLAFVHGRVPSGTSALAGFTVDADYTERQDHGTSRNSGTSQNVQMVLGSRDVGAGATLSGDTFTPSGSASMIALVVEVLEEPTASELDPTITPAVPDFAITTPRVDLRLGGGWTHEADVRYTGAGGSSIRIEYGRQNEQAGPGHNTCSLRLDNRTGNYAPRNPAAATYGKLGRNTGLRVARPVSTDAFDRTVASGGWGGDYAAIGGFDANYLVDGSSGIIRASTANKIYQVVDQSVQMLNPTVRAVLAPSELATGGDIQMAVMARWQDPENLYQLALLFATDGTMEPVIAKRVANVSSVIADAGATLAYTASSRFAVEFTVTGGLLHALVWDADDPSLYLEFSETDGSIATAGLIGARGYLASTNTNASIDLTFDDLEVDDMRFTGEVPAWPVAFDGTGTESTVSVSAASLSARLGRGRHVSRAAVRTYLEGLPSTGFLPSACWPLEEGELATAADPLYGQWPLRPFNGTHPSGAVTTAPQFGQGQVAPWLNPGFAWSSADGMAIMFAPVVMASTVTSWMVDLVVNLPADSADLFIDINPSYLEGSLGWPQLTLAPGDRLVLVALNGEPEISESVPDLFDGRAHQVRWFVSQSGAEVSTSVRVDNVLVLNDATAGAMTLPAVEHIAIGSLATTGTPAAVSWLTVWPGAAADEMIESSLGYAGETALTRLARLCSDNGIHLMTLGGTDETSEMGAQHVLPPYSLMEECATVDQGLLFDVRQVLALGYLQRRELRNQAAALTISYTGSELSGVPTVVDDLSLVVNDVTASRPGGGSRRHVVESGPLSTADPAAGGVGTYDRPVDAQVADESQLGRLAEWLTSLGTVDAPRITDIPMALHRTAVSSAQAYVALLVRDGNLVAIEGMPSAFLPPDASGLVIGGTESLDQFEHHLSYALVPDEVWSNAGIWDDSGSRWDSAYSTTAAEFVAGTDTSLSVAVEAGRSLWVTGSGSPQFPLQIAVAGVVLSVTAIAGASSPQTFTVAQTPVNGVTKTIPAGESVRLARPVRWGY